MDKNYVPILKGKEGEYFALKNLSNAAKAVTIPVIEILDFNEPYLTPAAKEKRKKAMPDFDSHIRKTVASIIDAWSGRKIFIDLRLVPINLLVTANFNYIEYIFEELLNNGLVAVPVVYQNDNALLRSELSKIISKYQTGVLARLHSTEINTNFYLKSIQKSYLLKASDVDLMVDFRCIIGHNTKTLYENVIGFIDNVLYDVAKWRSLILASGAFPVDLSGMVADTEERVLRRDLKLWKRVANSSVGRVPDFSDYTIAHSELPPPMKGVPNVSASIRYTTDKHWLVLRGKGTKKNGWNPIIDKCKDLIASPDYDGPTFSWGDQYIMDCANGVKGVGGAPMWRKVANNRHMEKSAQQLSSVAVLLASA